MEKVFVWCVYYRESEREREFCVTSLTLEGGGWEGQGQFDLHIVLG